MARDSFAALSILYWLAIAFFVLTTKQDWPLWIGVLSIPFYFWMLTTWRNHPRTEWVRQRRIEDDARQREAQDVRRETRQAAELAKEHIKRENALPPITAAEQFRSDLLRQYYAACKPPLAESFLLQIVEVFVSLYKPQTRQQALDYMSACLTSLVNFTKKIPAECLEPAKA
jgi:hypothetical protein